MDNGILQLAFNVHNNPGVYALLLGSGISQAAEILTGWEIVGDLIKQIAFTKNQNPQQPYEWYTEQYKGEARYDTLLEKLAPSPAERNAILKKYFEPTEDEKERGAKSPTQAHRAIATLVKKGFIRVILTTNFDRLLENALTEQGIVPDVLSSDDMIKGRTPLRHSPITLVKLHGDYRDWRSLNTSEELGTYSDEKKRILDEILNDYGLIVCGWSAKWDSALRDSIYGAISRRYTTYWAAYGEVNPTALELINHRRAQIINISDANHFFHELERTVDALEQSLSPNPLSLTVTIERIKKLIPRPDTQIQLEDLLVSIVNKDYANTMSNEIWERKRLVFQSQPEARETVANLYFDAAKTAIHAMTALVWYGEASQANHLTNAINLWTLDFDSQFEKGQFWISLPPLYLIYSCGIAAIFREKLPFLNSLLLEPRIKTRYSLGEDFPTFLHKFVELSLYQATQDSKSPKDPYWLNTHLEKQLRPIFHIIKHDSEYHKAFDLFETILAVVYISKSNDIKPNWMPPHLAYTTHRSWEYIEDFWVRFGKHINQHEVFLSQFFNSEVDQLRQNLVKYIELAKNFGSRTPKRFGIPNYASALDRGLKP